MTITILRLEPGQKVARPYNRAISNAEMAEVIMSGEFIAKNGVTNRLTHRINSELWNSNPGDYLDLTAVDTETPVFQNGKGVKYFAFTD